MREYILKMDPNRPRTYEEWQEAGYYVQKGSKCVGFNAAKKALFAKSQVRKKDEKPKDPHAEFCESGLAEEYDFHPDDPNFG